MLGVNFARDYYNDKVLPKMSIKKLKEFYFKYKELDLEQTFEKERVKLANTVYNWDVIRDIQKKYNKKKLTLAKSLLKNNKKHKIDNGNLKRSNLIKHEEVKNMLTKYIKETEPTLNTQSIKAKVNRWCLQPLTHFLGKSPNEIIEKGQGRKVIRLLEQILY